jgi:CubicO group peptidase (beta-lactamase class C family)
MSRKLVRTAKTAGACVLVLTVVAIGVAAFRPRPPQPPARVADIAGLEAYLDQIVRFGRPPGLSLAIVKAGRVVYQKGFGFADGPRRIPARPDTVYRWWSMTKIPTAIAILQLREQGRLSLGDPVAKYLPFFSVHYPSPASPVVTVRHLLNHSSGLPDLGLGLVRYVHREDEPPVNQTAFAEKVLPGCATLAFEPGSRAAYSNLGYILLGAIVESVTGQRYEDYVREHILAPLRMAHTDFVYTQALRPHAAAGSQPLLARWTPLLPLVVKDWGAFEREVDGGHIWFNTLYTDYTPSTGLIGDAPDVTRLMLAYLNDGEWEGQRILTAEGVSMMTHADRTSSAVAAFPDHRQGLGWVVACGCRECLEHQGGGPGFGTAFRVYPREGLGIVVLTNDMTTDTRAILRLAADLRWDEGSAGVQSSGSR